MKSHATADDTPSSNLGDVWATSVRKHHLEGPNGESLALSLARVGAAQRHAWYAEYPDRLSFGVDTVEQNRDMTGALQILHVRVENILH